MLAILVVLLGIVGALSVAVAFGTARWARATARAVAALHAAEGDPADPPAPTRFSPQVLAGLPPPVQRYFSLVLTPGQSLVRRARVRHVGEFALRPNAWKPLESQQHFTVHPPGFVWDASIRMFPLVPVRVRDAYLRGHGSMLGAVAGVATVADQAGTPGMAAGALLRYLAEAAWMPTALLPGRGVHWTGIDDSTALARLTDGGVSVSMEVHFGPGGEMARINAVRERDVNGTSVPTPWEAHHSAELLTVDGMKIPASGEVAWILPEGRHSYWRARVVDASYDRYD